MGSRWFDEIKDDFKFAILCRGDTKVFSQTEVLSLHALYIIIKFKHAYNKVTNRLNL